MTREIPPAYRQPTSGEPDSRWRFYVTEQDGTGATPLFIVIACGGGEQHIVGTDMYLHWALITVDALRAAGPVDQPITHPLAPSTATRVPADPNPTGVARPA